MFLADDNLIVREGVRALLSIADDIEVVGVAGDYDELVAGADALTPQVVVTDIRMPPNFTDEGIAAARLVRRQHPGTGVVILSQYDEPEYAIALLSEGAAGYAYLLKDRVAEGDQLARAVREVTTGGSMLDPRIVNALTKPVTEAGGLSSQEERLLAMVAEGRPIKAIAVVTHATPEFAVSDAVEQLFPCSSRSRRAPGQGALQRLRLLHKAIVDREEQGESLSRMLPGGIATRLREQGMRAGETERLTVTVLMSDIRAYSTIAEMADPTVLAGQLHEHRAEMNHALLGEHGTVMQRSWGTRSWRCSARPSRSRTTASARWRRLTRCTCARPSPTHGWETQPGFRPSTSASAFPLGTSPPPCWGLTSARSTRWSAMPSTWHSGCSNGRRGGRPC